MRLSRLAWCALALGLSIAAIAAIAAIGLAAAPDDEAQRRIDYELELHRTKRDVALFMGAAPDTCARGIGSGEFCTWHLAKGKQGWHPLAKALGFDGALSLVCELPTGRKARDPGSCRAYPRSERASSYYLEPAMYVSRLQRKRNIKRRKAFREEARVRAQRDLDEAGRVWDLIELVGSGPGSCAATASGDMRCFWRATRETFGHALLSIWIEDSGPLRLTCDLPADGSARNHDACAVQRD